MGSCADTYQPITKSSDRSGYPKKYVIFANVRAKTSISGSCSEDDDPLVRPTTRKEPVEERRDPATDDEGLLPLVTPRLPSAVPVRKRKGPPVWEDPTATLEQQVSRDSREREEETSISGSKAEGEALRKIINKLSDERNLRDLHLKHDHMSTAQFKKRTTHLDIPRRIYEMKTCPILQFRTTETGKISRERTSGRRIWRPHLFRSWVGKDWRQNLRISDCFGGATSHLTAYPCKSTSPSEVIAKLHEWMDTFQMNPRRFVQTWLSTIFTTCRHSAECTA